MFNVVYIRVHYNSMQSHQLTSNKYQRSCIFLGYWAATFAEGASKIIIPLYFYSIGINASKIAITFMFYEIFGLLTTMFSGVLINKWGYKRAFLISLILHTVASFGYLFISNASIIFVAILVNGLRSLRGIGNELMKTTGASYYKHFSKSHIDNQFLLGGKESIKGIGFLVGSFLLTVFSFKQSFIILGSISFVCLLFSIVFLDDYRDLKKVTFTGFFKVNKNLKILALIRSFLYAGRDIWLVIALPLFMIQEGYSNLIIGFTMAIGLIIFGIIQPLTGLFVKSEIKMFSLKIKKKWYYKKTVVSSSLLMTCMPLVIMKSSSSLVYLIISICIYNILAGFSTAPHNYLHIRLAEKDRASIDISFYQMISQLGKVVAAILAGIIFDKYGLYGCLYTSTLFLFIAAYLGLFLNIKSK
jgi:predicted MFS family arabinose efflux permease